MRAIAVAALLLARPAVGDVGKRGLSGVEGCDDAKTLGLSGSWHYNWGLWPTQMDAGGNSVASGVLSCKEPQAAEFVPMFWGCWDNCTLKIWPSIHEDWKKIGVKYILGFNEPDNAGQSDLTPEKAAEYWTQLDDFANSFSPPLELVGPGMTHWGADGGSEWLDAFFGNLSDTRKANIKFLAQHDYDGNASALIAKANAAYKKYNRKVWLTEFAVGFGKDRATNDAYMKELLPMLDAAESVARYAWYSTRNAPADFVEESYLLPPKTGGWEKQGHTACAQDEMLWLLQHGTAAECEALALDTAGCVTPKAVIWQSGSPQNCYCANTTSCTKTHSSWQDTYVLHGQVPEWKKSSKMACAPNEMLWLSQYGTARECQAKATAATSGCLSGPTKTVLYESGDVQNCYCANTTCTKTPTDWLDQYVQPTAPALSQVPSSSGKLYIPK